MMRLLHFNAVIIFTADRLQKGLNDTTVCW